MLEGFLASLTCPAPPADLPVLLTALWWDAKGDWNRAHELAQAGSERDAAWVHAYLHRKEGDAANAGYWYRRAHRAFPTSALEEEWREIALTLLDGTAPPR